MDTFDYFALAILTAGIVAACLHFTIWLERRPRGYRGERSEGLDIEEAIRRGTETDGDLEAELLRVAEELAKKSER